MQKIRSLEQKLNAQNEVGKRSTLIQLIILGLASIGFVVMVVVLSVKMD